MSVYCSTFAFALSVCLVGVCDVDFGFDILLFTLFLHLICRVVVFVVRLHLYLQFVCVFSSSFFKSSVGICISRYVVCLCICIYLVVHLCTIMILFVFSSCV